LENIRDCENPQGIDIDLKNVRKSSDRCGKMKAEKGEYNQMAKNPSPHKEISINAVPDPHFEIPYPRYYSNYISVHHTPYDFTLRFCDALPIYEMPELSADGTAEIKIPIKTEVVIPAAVFPDLIKAMQDQYKKYQKKFEGAAKNEKEE